MKKILNTLFEQKRLTKEQSKEVLINIAQEKYNTSQIAAFITVFLMRPVSVDELSGFREALLELAIKVDLSDFNTIDLCGTGGDGKNTFNISTLTSFIVAGTGHKVAKHGNYGVSSASGSSNMLEFLGYKFTNNESTLKHQLEEANICFLHAPLFHPAMKVVAPIRKELGVKTFFNMLGPLVNPSQPQNQLVGVFNLEVARVYNYMLQQSNVNYGVVHALDGYDEISLTGDFKLFTQQAEQQISPADLGQQQISPSAIFGGNNVEEAADIFVNIINGKGTAAQNNVVLTNAAFALKTFDKNKSFEIAFEEAKDSLLGLKAKTSLEKLVY
ncbi:anthranilate phosphoribosyltransferase [Tenacibaculum tangerinum]|uniref:Anthranilate phosphoribosyltransferase n=1 Tax=Tenacibaculum tangerinum TaxID=3038772 RepID=A0ABY8L1G8_9FLAO|nr:anthranilate phosphoribosyltransferase [Tenacibaculum tangerinum]WGH75294.1 anthranilate phosphoribosyltransferase [Tenacibaculum tangerinum]